MTPKISLIIPTYNRKQFLPALLRSVLAEKIGSCQIIVVDDGSTDGTWDSLSDFPVTFLSSLPGQRRGPAHARNRGLSVAAGELVTFLDSDDVVAEQGITSRINWLEQHPEVLSVGGQPAGVINELGKIVPVNFPRPLPSVLRLDYFQRGGKGCAIWPFVFRKALIQRVGRFDEKLQITDDFDYLLRILSVTDIPILESPSVFYRFHHQNLSIEADRKQKKKTRAEHFLMCLQYKLPLQSSTNASDERAS